MAYAKEQSHIRLAKRTCSKCKTPHRDTQYAMCEICRDLGAAYHQLWRQDHRERGLCTECVERRRKGDYIPGALYMKCQVHLDYHREWHEASRAERREKGLCLWGACKQRAEGYYCDEHKERMVQYRRRLATKRAA
jgi:hypothetical protein